MILRDNGIIEGLIYEIEPMIVGLTSAMIIHLIGIKNRGRV